MDCDGEAFRLMSDSPAWLTRDDAFRTLVAAAPAGRKAYLADVRDALRQHRSTNARSSWVWLYSMRSERSALLSFD